ncbi:nucleotidyltransferase [Lutispora thermophila]|uniref:tRNA(Met) cytidine acetate ligase n=1 Tax=Lutispora thermophila DSM 19022 TaxID=1122184 RepID=A0A1M6G431_9FIRM|nr:nucleotidyltransferase [Lutispora thermophila]SHJ04755.1 Predicted nucleotidyltransferase [Lutispora thermophila DSM 19022]
MKVLGIVSEYNPFHNGHKYHLEMSKKICDAQYSVAVMSGNFLQRGTPALFDKWTRAKMAVLNGVDLVIELPVIYSCQVAEIFAFGAVKLFNYLGIIDYISFGSENGNIDDLYKVAYTLLDEPEYIRNQIKDMMSKGMTYSKALGQVYNKYYENILQYPNNVLGIEYIKSIIYLNSSIKPITIKRVMNNYNDTDFTGTISSATAIREAFRSSEKMNSIRMATPDVTWDIMMNNIEKGKGPVFWENFSDTLLYEIRRSSHHDIERLPEIREGLEYRLKKAGNISSSFEELITNIKTKRYTRTSLQRTLCHLLLGIYKEDVKKAVIPQCPMYIRVLALNSNGRYLLKEIKKNTDLPIINKAAAFNPDSSYLKRVFDLDVMATDIYNLGYRYNSYKTAGEDFRTSPFYADLL